MEPLDGRAARGRCWMSPRLFGGCRGAPGRCPGVGGAGCPPGRPCRSRAPFPLPFVGISGLLQPPPSRCRSHGNGFGCTPGPAAPQGPSADPPPPPPWGSVSPKCPPRALGDGALWGSVGHPKMGAVLGEGAHPVLGMQPPLSPVGEGMPNSPRGGGTAPRAGHPGISSSEEECGHGQARRTRPWLPAQLVCPRGWHRDGTGMVAGGQAGHSHLHGAAASGRAAVPAQTRPWGLSVPLIIQI